MVRLPRPSSPERVERHRRLGEWGEDSAANTRFHNGLLELINDQIDDYTHASACLTLAGFYYESPPGAPLFSRSKAWKYLEESADCGLHSAWVVMAEAHVKGDRRFGVKQDLQLAKRELQRAIELIDAHLKVITDPKERDQARELRVKYMDHLDSVSNSITRKRLVGWARNAAQGALTVSRLFWK